MDKPTRERVFSFIETFYAERGYAPSYREIAEGSGLASASTVLHHLASLRDEGRIDFVEQTPRTVHIINQEQE